MTDGGVSRADRFADRLRRRLRPRALKRLMPTSLLWRAILIIVLPVALMQVAVPGPAPLLSDWQESDLPEILPVECFG
jgi:hypothetical protein